MIGVGLGICVYGDIVMLSNHHDRYVIALLDRRHHYTTC